MTMDPLESRRPHTRVEFRGGDLDMPEEELHGTKVGPTFQEMGSAASADFLDSIPRIEGRVCC